VDELPDRAIEGIAQVKVPPELAEAPGTALFIVTIAVSLDEHPWFPTVKV
jgi:hypothetical protein